jgi:hypothetical protein
MLRKKEEELEEGNRRKERKMMTKWMESKGRKVEKKHERRNQKETNRA